MIFCKVGNAEDTSWPMSDPILNAGVLSSAQRNQSWHRSVFDTHLQCGPILMNTLNVSEGFGGR